MSYEVETGDLRESAAAATAAAGEVRGAAPGEALEGVGEALPGGSAQNAIASVAFWWSVRFDSWARRADQYALGLEGNAGTYDRDDDAAAEAFGGR